MSLSPVASLAPEHAVQPEGDRKGVAAAAGGGRAQPLVVGADDAEVAVVHQAARREEAAGDLHTPILNWIAKIIVTVLTYYMYGAENQVNVPSESAVCVRAPPASGRARAARKRCACGAPRSGVTAGAAEQMATGSQLRAKAHPPVRARVLLHDTVPALEQEGRQVGPKYASWPTHSRGNAAIKG